MQAIKNALGSKWLYVGLGTGIVCALIFTLGPMISIAGFAPLDNFGSQLLASMLIPVGYTVTYLIQSHFQSLIHSRVTNALSGIGTGQADEAGAGESRRGGGRDGAAAAGRELETISGRFREALATLKGRRFAGASGRRWLYQLPWYVMIGPPGSGKTTAIVNSGLSFPLAEKFGRKAVGGVGGTRNCDWWFTDDAVLIDTAGRYMTQDSDAEQDKAAWLGFLRLLRRHRRRQPLNGVLVAIGISELTSTSEEARLDHAARIRQRVLELYRELGLRLPVYVMLTKSDLLAGFVEFFDDLGREGREAVWGFTFAHEPEREGGPMEAYEAEYDALVGRLGERLLERMQQESDIQRRALVFGFPQQVASLKHLTHQFMQEAFAPNSFEEPIMLRGVYFVSGTQVGTPLDRVVEAMSRTFDVARPPRPTLGGQKRSYFISRLLREVVFAEAGLVNADPRAERRRRRLQYGLYAGIVAVVAAVGILWTISYSRNVDLIETVQLTASSYAAEANSLKLDRVDSADLRPVAPLLQKLREIPTGYAEGDAAPGRLVGFGLDQSDKLSVQTRAAYRHALNTLLLPRLILRLEAVLAERQDDPAFLYEALKVYLMLGQQGPLQRDVVRNWMVLDWGVQFPGDADAGLRRALAGHLDALLEGPLSNIGLNGELIGKSRARLQGVSLARRVLDTVVASAEAGREPSWRLADHAGPVAEGVLTRRSGQPLSAGIPGIYTSAGFYDVFLPQLPQVADAVAADGWVLDPQAAAAPAGGEASLKLQREASALYAQEFALRWDQLIGDIAIRPMRTVDDSLRTLNTLAAPTSPIRLLLVAAAQETKLERPPAPEDAASAGDGAAQQGKTPPSKLEALFRSQVAADTPEAIARRYLNDHFQSLHQLVDVPANSQADAQAPIDSAIRDLGGLYRSLSEMQGLGGAGSLQKGDQAAVAIRQIEAGASNLPEPIRQWILGVSRTSSDLSITGAKRQLTSVWSSGPGALCQRATEGRYPFTPGSAQDVPLSDFARLFGRNGAIDSFFAENLAPFVDMSEGSWKVRPTGNVDFRLDRGTLAQFERAAAIRDSMFQDAGAQPSVGFVLTVAETDPSTETVVVDIDGQRLESRRGQSAAMHFRWPAAGGVGGASVTFTGGQDATLSRTGAWGLFRLLDQADTRRLGGSDRLQLRLTAGTHWATFLLQADSVMNPLSGKLLSQFRCPQDL
ncbi:type VI secretion system membrane subunit TssM [Inquilinus sp. Marseille-Q2685]|uniref:type VI secretion system membrane subunit TssM n=1 Tax=Inquilinus sp. Marseille-Q2685 TaxID=2866581 RepID=UPI001CE43078|nr:type VI secretion system membrane subunit TssM [Inquilinus sp. Marseille-Q2685]